MSAKQLSAISLFSALNGLNKLPEMHFKFPFNLINKLTMVLLIVQLWCVLKSWYTGGSPEHGFLHCFADRLNQKLSSFCGAGYCTLLVQTVINLIFLPGKGNCMVCKCGMQPTMTLIQCTCTWCKGAGKCKAEEY